MSEGLAVPALSLLLARGTQLTPQGGDDSLEGALFGVFGHGLDGCADSTHDSPRGARLSDPEGQLQPTSGATAATVHGHWPVAPVTRLVDDPQSTLGACVRVDPVHLNAQPHGATVTYGDSLTLAEEEARALVTALADASSPGPPLALTPTRWYLPLDAGAHVVGLAPSLLTGRTRDSLLPTGTGARQWRSWMTEVQMLLHQSEINVAREARGVPPINSVWIWGAGTLPSAHPVAFDAVHGNDSVLRGLASLHGVRWAGSEPESAESVLTEDGVQRRLVVLGEACLAAARGDVERWRAVVEQVERDWAVPLEQAVREGRVASLTIDCPPFAPRRVTRKNLWRVWRRPDRLERLVEQI